MLEVLRPAKAGRWRALIDALPAERRDIHYLPEYGRLYEETHGFEALLAVYSTDAAYVLQPFVRRPLAGLPFLAGETRAAWDSANPYGYGGPLCTLAADDPAARELYTRFYGEFGNWCDRHDVASEFSTLHPFMLEHQRYLIPQARHEKDVVYMPLAGGEAALLKGLNRGHRSSVSRARRAGVRVAKVEATRANVAAFAEIYAQTMERRNAAPRWLLGEDFFAAFCRLLGAARSSLFFAYVGEELECAYLLMHDFGTAYYQFAGTRGAYPELRVNNLTMLETAAWAAGAGYERYLLGGGVTSAADDSLLRFKAGFSARRAPLYTYFCIRSRVVYDALCERKKAFERATQGGESTSGFLPLYRR